MTSFSLSIDGHQPLTGDLQLNAALPSNVFRVRKWGDPIMVAQAGLSTSLIGTSNFQAVGLYNKSNYTFGGVSNFLRIPMADVAKLRALQVEDDFKDKKPEPGAWLQQKMNWLIKSRGTIYFYYHHSASIYPSDYVEWGTIELGWNFCTVLDVETLKVRTPDNVTRTRKMCKLAGFRKSDWDVLFDGQGNKRPDFQIRLGEFVSRGLIQRCYCAYMGDDLGDSPKGIVYSPFWSPRDWTFISTSKPQIDGFYIPEDWLIDV